mmetsp:Transcript_17091/g.36192  ORF Transcript_17091/g.36192 Transcript_17091/m.36192 type:complete len:200 (+) Transcript_17091:480-1079(+)
MTSSSKKMASCCMCCPNSLQSVPCLILEYDFLLGLEATSWSKLRRSSFMETSDHSLQSATNLVRNLAHRGSRMWSTYISLSAMLRGGDLLPHQCSLASSRLISPIVRTLPHRKCSTAWRGTQPERSASILSKRLTSSNSVPTRRRRASTSARRTCVREAQRELLIQLSIVRKSASLLPGHMHLRKLVSVMSLELRSWLT